jgi:hypothetical protein
MIFTVLSVLTATLFTKSCQGGAIIPKVSKAAPEDNLAASTSASLLSLAQNDLEEVGSEELKEYDAHPPFAVWSESFEYPDPVNETYSMSRSN